MAEENGFVSVIFKGRPWGDYGLVTVSVIGRPINFQYSWLNDWQFVDEGLPEESQDIVLLKPMNRFRALHLGYGSVDANYPLQVIGRGNAGNQVYYPVRISSDMADRSQIQNGFGTGIAFHAASGAGASGSSLAGTIESVLATGRKRSTTVGTCDSK